MPYLPNCDVLWIGSYPLRDPRKACRLILRNDEMLLHWPQLPKRAAAERMIPQTSGALRTADGSFKRGTASGWSSMWSLLRQRGARQRRARDGAFKTHLAGPVTLFGKLLSAKSVEEVHVRGEIGRWLKHAYWQIDRIKDRDLKPVIVLDEPLLPDFMGPAGSARSRKMLRHLGSVIRRLKRRGALTGVHCCNRITPGALIETGADLIHFDAHHFPSQVKESLPKLREFLRDGGIVAWGIIPTTETLDSSARLRIEKRFLELLTGLEGRSGLPLRTILAQSMVAPTCGTGLLSTEQSEKILDFAGVLSRQFKSRYKL